MIKADTRKKMIQQGFDTVAAGYDHPALSFFPETAKRLVEHLHLSPSDNLLDVCTGTGVVAITAAKKLAQGSVTGVDLSSGMLQQAKKNAKDAGVIDRAKFIQIDVDELSLEKLNRANKPFDVTTCSFGLFFLEDMNKGLSNIANTVREGGKLAITSFAGEAFSPMAEIFIENFKATGREMPPPSWKRLSTEALVRQQFKEVGITNVTIHQEPLGYQMTSAQMWWDVCWNAGWRTFLNQMSEPEQKTFKKNHLKKIDKVIGDDGVWFNTEVLIAVGEKRSNDRR